MPIIASALNTIGLVLLAHAVYSAYEHSLISTTPASSSTSSRSSALTPKLTLPTDIILETLLSVLLLCVGIVLAAPDLRPIRWREWAGKIEREKRAGPLKNLDEGLGGNPYVGLEQRTGFVDIRKMRGEFKGWMEKGGR